MNIFAIFFILAAHEHYSIDVFVAFYITSRLFLYYHSLSNNRVLRQPDCTRTRIWFPLFSYFESSINGIVPNEYEWPLSTLCRYVRHKRSKKDSQPEQLGNNSAAIRSSDTYIFYYISDRLGLVQFFFCLFFEVLTCFHFESLVYVGMADRWILVLFDFQVRCIFPVCSVLCMIYLIGRCVSMCVWQLWLYKFFSVSFSVCSKLCCYVIFNFILMYFIIYYM